MLASKITEAMDTLGWDNTDDIVVEIGGTAVSGIHQREDANPKWSSPYGTRKYNKDAFIVIKNRDRSPFEPSKENPELIAHHAKEIRRGDQEDNGSNSTEEPEVSA